MRLALLLVAAPLLAAGSPGDRFLHLDDPSPFHPDRGFARLTTPMWFGEEGVEAAVILSIDDMRETGKYRLYLEPILARLRELEGRSPLSIFTNTIDPADPQLGRWLSEGVRFDVHTRSHPCPLLRSSFEEATREVLECLSNLRRIPGSSPVAFRMPCCDSINSASPRFFREILPLKTGEGAFLQVDSSVLMFLEDSYRPYAPFKNYAATAEGYPYPYVVGRTLWEFPIIAPTDWQAQHRRKPNHPQTVEDLKRGLDLVAAAQGLYTFCFHPHGWIESKQVVEVIDHAAERHGRRVRFLSFHDALERMERHLLGGVPLRAADGGDSGARLLDLNGDGFLDVVVGNDRKRESRVWDPRERKFRVAPFPFRISAREGEGPPIDTGVRFAVLRPGGNASAAVISGEERGLAHFDGSTWTAAPRNPLEALRAGGEGILTALDGRDRGARFRDLDGDGFSDLLVNNESQNAAFRWDPVGESFLPLPFALPSLSSLVDGEGRDRGLRFVDLNGDGREDLVLSNDDEHYLYLHEGPARGWSGRVLHGPHGGPGGIPRIVSGGRDQGAWFKDKAMYVMNEKTAGRPDLVEVRRFDRAIEHRAAPPRSPEEALPLFKVADGFRVELVAAEPLVTSPVSLEFGPDGRIWVTEMGGYPTGAGKDAAGRVKVLRDADGDGQVDAAVVFAEGLSFPTGALPFGKGALVTCAPEIIHFEDQDGDGRADSRKVVFSGFGEGNQQHRVNGLRWSIDGWIHGANGDSGGRIASASRPELPPVDIGGRDFRFLPTLESFEAESGRTQFGLAFDDFQNRFGTSNSRHLMHAVLPERYLRRNPHHAAPDPVVDIPDHGAMARIFPISSQLLSLNSIHVPGHFSSACGVAIYRGDSFPEAYRGNAFVCEPVGNLVHRDLLVPEGATFRAERAEKGSEFLSSSDHWFRPVNLANGPDGALYVVDMYRYVIEHPEYIPEDIRQILDFSAGRDRGRIWRVVHGERPARPRASLHPDLTREGAGRLVELLGHPAGWWRDAAQRVLLERRELAAAPALKALWAATRAAPTRLHALWTLSGLGALEDRLLEEALEDPHPAVREHALRISEARLGNSPRLLEKAIARAADGDFRVRLQAAFTLGESGDAAAGEALGRILTRDIEDRWMRAAVLSSSLHHAGRLLSGLLRDGAGEDRRGDGPAKGWRDAMESLVRVVTRKGEPEEVKAVLGGIRSKGEVRRWHLWILGALVESGKAPPAEAVGPGLRHIRERAAEIAGDGREPLAERVEAVKALGEALLERRDLLSGLLGPREPVELGIAVVRTLARTPSAAAAAAERLLEAFGEVGPAARTEVLESLLALPGGARAVLDAIEGGKIGAREVDAPSRIRLEESVDSAGRARASRLFPRAPPGGREEVVARYRTAASAAGADPSRGKETFKKHCASCHRLEGEGVNVGPDLVESGARDEASLLEAILNPSRMVPPRYTPYLVETRGRGVLSGLIASESATSIGLVRSGGISETVLREDIRKLTALGESLMPAELEKLIGPEEMADLLAFLRRRPRPLESLSPVEMEETRKRTLAEGHNGLAEVLAAPERAPQASFAGTVEMPLVRLVEGGGPLVWRTRPAPSELGPKGRAEFRFPAAMGYRSQPGGPFTLFLGDRKLLDFEVSLETTSFRSEDGRVELRYTVRTRNAEDSTGEMTLELPASLLEPGKPATLRVTGSPAGSRRWFGLLPLGGLPSTVPSSVPVFTAGEGGYHTYRIPAVVASARGTLLAFCEGRRKGTSDTGDIDLLLRRSQDGGKSWGPLQVVADHGPDTIGNPCPVVDRPGGTIWLPLTWNLGEDSEDEIKSRTGKGTRRVLIARSDDDGATWSEALDITSSAKDPCWTWYATGPGCGIQLRSGRLLIPCDHAVEGNGMRRSHVILSDDHGKSWRIGGVLGDLTNECQAVELSDGAILLNMRSYHGKNRRAVSRSSDGGLTWTEPVLDPLLIEPVCQASFLRGSLAREGKGKDRLLFSNPASTRREKMTVRLSYDEGKTWPASKLLHAGPAAYSSLVVLPDGSVGCLYERGEKRPYEAIVFTRFSLEWLEGSGTTEKRG